MSKQTFIVDIEAGRPIGLDALTRAIITAAALAQEHPAKGEVEEVRVRPVTDANNTPRAPLRDRLLIGDYVDKKDGSIVQISTITNEGVTGTRGERLSFQDILLPPLRRAWESQ